MSKSILSPLMALFSLLIFAGCASNFAVSNDYDREADFKSFRTFELLEPTPEMLEKMKSLSPRTLQFIRDAIREEMVKRGYREVEQGADLGIAFFATAAITTVGQEVGGVNVGVGWGGYYGGIGVGGRVGGRVQYVDYVDGSLVIDMYAPASQQLLWTGRARGTFQAETTDPRKVSYEAVKQILFRYKWKVRKGG